MMSGLAGVRHEPTAKRICALLGGMTVVDSTRAVLTLSDAVGGLPWRRAPHDPIRV